MKTSVKFRHRRFCRVVYKPLPLRKKNNSCTILARKRQTQGE